MYWLNQITNFLARLLHIVISFYLRKQAWHQREENIPDMRSPTFLMHATRIYEVGQESKTKASMSKE